MNNLNEQFILEHIQNNQVLKSDEEFYFGHREEADEMYNLSCYVNHGESVNDNFEWNNIDSLAVL